MIISRNKEEGEKKGQKWWKEVKEKESRVDDKFVTFDKERYEKAVEAQKTFRESLDKLIKYFEKVYTQYQI